MAPMVREQTRQWLDMYEIPHDSLTFTKNKATLGLDYFLSAMVVSSQSSAAGIFSCSLQRSIIIDDARS